jgi:hypothetical protein
MNKNYRTLKILVGLLLSVGAVHAKVDLVTVPTRDTVQLTIYNSADLTLVNESRALTLKKGNNQLQFSWANTLIDPTSLEMVPVKNADQIDIQDLVFPPRVKNLGLWNVTSQMAGKSPVNIRYLTSGLSWRAFYEGVLSPNEKTMHLKGYVRVTNNSGEDYENAQTRLIVGKVHLLDQIAQLARRQYPYGRPLVVFQPPAPAKHPRPKATAKLGAPLNFAYEYRDKKEIIKEGLSEYFLYTIEGTETIPNGWSKRLPSFEAADIPVVNLYKFEAERYGSQPRRFLSFKNDETHKLGDTPIPGGSVRVFGESSYVGATGFKYIPVNEKVELVLGSVKDVIVKPKLMKTATDRYQFDHNGNIIGWNKIEDFQMEVRNTRAVPIKIEIKRNFRSTYWSLKKAGDFGQYEQDDKNTVKFTLELPPHSKKQFTYQLTTRYGTNQN